MLFANIKNLKKNDFKFYNKHFSIAQLVNATSLYFSEPQTQ